MISSSHFWKAPRVAAPSTSDCAAVSSAVVAIGGWAFGTVFMATDPALAKIVS